MVSPRKITSDQRELCKSGFLAITPLYVTNTKAMLYLQHDYVACSSLRTYGVSEVRATYLRRTCYVVFVGVKYVWRMHGVSGLIGATTVHVLVRAAYF